jgi:hypothetical protein
VTATADRALRSTSAKLDRVPTLAAMLRGEWLGHPLHPVLTDLPIGFWTSAWVLDFLPGQRAAAQKLVGLGLLSAVPTALAGVADANTVGREKDRTVTRHAIANATATTLYALSWWQRRRGHHWRGVVVGQFAAAAATVGGYLGGELVFGGGAD